MAENVYLYHIDYKNYTVKMEQKHVHCQIHILLLDQEHIGCSLVLGWWSTKVSSIIQHIVHDLSFIPHSCFLSFELFFINII